MIQSKAFDFVNILGKAADASWQRNNVLMNNISNATTPGYKRKDVSFNSFLLEELESTSGSIRDKVSNVDLSNLKTVAYTDMRELSYRLDGNNVDIDTENVEFASNQIFYNALLNSINHEFSMLRAAISKS